MASATIMGQPGSDIDWEAYAASYDAVTWANPAYRALVDRVAMALDKIDLAPDAQVADLGCGTGTFTKLLLDRVPDGRVLALDTSSAFLGRLVRKHGSQTALVTQLFDMNRDAMPAPLDAVVSVHALCHATRPREVLAGILAALRPGGTLVIADIGRPLVWSDWLGYMWQAINRDFASKGWGVLSPLPSAAFFIRHRQASRINGDLSRRQARGEIWTHSLGEFASALEDVGFEVVETDGEQYRGVDSFAVAQKPEEVHP